MLLSGNETRLKKKLIETAVSNPDYEVHEVDARDENIWTDLYTVADRHTKEKLTIVYNAEAVASWAPLSEWLSVCKRNRTILETSDVATEKRVAALVQNKGSIINCSNTDRSPTLVKLLASWYQIQQAQMLKLLERCYWHISSALELLDKCALLGVQYTPEVVDVLGLPLLVEAQFKDFLLKNKKASAMMVIPKIRAEAVPGLLADLDTELTLLARIHAAQVGMKPAREIARDLGLKTQEVVDHTVLARQYTIKRSLTSTLALGNATRDWFKHKHLSVLEVLVSSW